MEPLWLLDPEAEPVATQLVSAEVSRAPAARRMCFSFIVGVSFDLVRVRCRFDSENLRRVNAMHTLDQAVRPRLAAGPKRR